MRLSGLVLRNLRRHRRSFTFASVGIVLGVSSFVIFLGLGQGLRKNVLERVFVVDQVEVVPKRYQMGAVEVSGSLFAGSTELDEFTLQDISEIPGVAAVFPKMQISFPSMAWGGEQLFGRNFATEFMAEGIPAELIGPELPTPDDESFAFTDWDLDRDLVAQCAAEAEDDGEDEDCSGLDLCVDGDCTQHPYSCPSPGAEGIGLTRTEHMFFEGNRIVAMRKMILAENEAGRKKALKALLPLQRKDFIGIFKALKGRPATIRFLDPPLHEFVPHDKSGQAELAKAMGVPTKQITEKVASLHEFNPMLGHRGCRLGIYYPEITAMQTRAVIEAAYAVPGAQAEIMIPLVGNVKELINQKQIVLETFAAIKKEKKGKTPPKIKIGTMIEVPRGAITADEIAPEVDFFSFGTNDMTQMGCGFSRDDAQMFLNQYVELGIYNADPFQTLDRKGIGELVRIAVTKGRSVRPGIKLGICGEHGGDPSSIEFCHMIGLNYVSCSPYRVPIARLAAAQAAITQGPKGALTKTKKKAKKKKK